MPRVNPSEIFISYRRNDPTRNARTIYESLDTQDFAQFVGQPLRIFRDNKTMQPGQEWRNEIDYNASGCQLLLLVIGPDWVEEIEKRSTIAELDPEEPIDWVRRELRLALERPSPAQLLIIRHETPQANSKQLHMPFTLAEEKAIRHALKRADLNHLVYEDHTEKADLHMAVRNAWIALDSIPPTPGPEAGVEVLPDVQTSEEASDESLNDYGVLSDESLVEIAQREIKSILSNGIIDDRLQLEMLSQVDSVDDRRPVTEKLVSQLSNSTEIAACMIAMNKAFNIWRKEVANDRALPIWNDIYSISMWMLPLAVKTDVLNRSLTKTTSVDVPIAIFPRHQEIGIELLMVRAVSGGAQARIESMHDADEGAQPVGYISASTYTDFIIPEGTKIQNYCTEIVRAISRRFKRVPQDVMHQSHLDYLNAQLDASNDPEESDPLIYLVFENWGEGISNELARQIKGYLPSLALSGLEDNGQYRQFYHCEPGKLFGAVDRMMDIGRKLKAGSNE